MRGAFSSPWIMSIESQPRRVFGGFGSFRGGRSQLVTSSQRTYRAKMAPHRQKFLSRRQEPSESAVFDDLQVERFAIYSTCRSNFQLCHNATVFLSLSESRFLHLRVESFHAFDGLRAHGLRLSPLSLLARLAAYVTDRGLTAMAVAGTTVVGLGAVG